MKNIFNINIDNLFMSPKERQLNKLKKFIAQVVKNTQHYATEFEIKEGSYKPNDLVSKCIDRSVDITEPLSGKAIIFTDDNPSNTKIVCMTLADLEELVSLYKEALDMK